LPALNATEKKVFHTGNKIVYSKPMVNWTARTTTNRLVAEIKGMLVNEQDAPRSPVRILVIDPNTQPPVNGKPKVLDVPLSTTQGLEPPKATSSTPDLHNVIPEESARLQLPGSCLGPSTNFSDYAAKRRSEIALLYAHTDSLVFQEGKQIGVDLVRVGGGHAVRKAFVGLQYAIPQQLCRQRRRIGIRHDLVVIAMHH
jgi:hypothetical protein